MSDNLDLNGLNEMLKIVENKEVVMMDKGYWSDLPLDILHKIRGRLNVLERVWFGVVCKHWQSASLSSPEKLPSVDARAPWLMTTRRVFHEECLQSSIREFINFSTNENCNISSTFTLNFPGAYIYSSRDGWFLMYTMVDESNHPTSAATHPLLIKHSVHLINPFTQSKIKMPRFRTVRGATTLGTFSTGHCNNAPHCVVVASSDVCSTYDPYAPLSSIVTLRIAHPGDNEWMEFEYRNEPGVIFSLDSLVMVGQDVHCIDTSGNVFVFYLGNYVWTKCSMPIIEEEPTDMPDPFYVVTNGEIIKVQESEGTPSLFDFFKLNEAKTEWLQLNKKDQLLEGKTWYLGFGNSWARTATTGSESGKVYEIKFISAKLTRVYARDLDDNSFQKILGEIDRQESNWIRKYDHFHWVDLG